MTKNAQDFARELTSIVDASANALTTLNRVLRQQQQNILKLASEAGVPAPSAVGPGGVSRQADPQAVVTAPAPQTVSAEEASPGAVSPEAASPEDLLAQAERTAQALIDHAPGVAISHIYQAAAHAVSLALMNTVGAQQQLNTVAQAVVTRGAAQQLSSARPKATAPAEKASGPERAAG